MSVELNWDGGLQVRGSPEHCQSIAIIFSFQILSHSASKFEIVGQKFQLLLMKNLLCAWLSKRRNFFFQFRKKIFQNHAKPLDEG